MKNSKSKNFNIVYLNFNKSRSKILLVMLVIITAAYATLSISGAHNKQNLTRHAFSYNGPAVTVIIDAGHGGEDGGTSSKNKDTLEKDINLKIALKLKDFLILNGFNVIMIREDDISIYDEDKNKSIHQKKVSDINNRIEIANQNKDAFYISIHQNFFPQQSVKGTQVFYSKGNPQSRVLAKMLQDNFISDFEQDGKREIKEAYNDILLMKKIENVAVLVECGFLSNPQELKNLQDENYQSKIAFTIMRSLYQYLLQK